MADVQCDVAIIGAGTAGISAERSARRHGARTLLIDDRFPGTTCASVGCMPSKLLIAAGKAAQAVKRAPDFGVMAAPARIDGPAVMRRVRALRDKFVAGVDADLAQLPPEQKIRARAKFAGPTELALDDGRRISAKAVIVATGSSPSVPKPFQALGDLVLTNESVFEIVDLPRSLAVIGGGAIGLELAQAMARLGVRVVLFDMLETLGGVKDEKVAAALRDIIGAEVALHLGVTIESRIADGRARLRWSGASEGEEDFDRVLVAAGRPPNLAGLDLEAAGLALDKRGAPVFDRTTMQCGDTPVFIAGDANADAPLLHEASDEGAIAGRNAATFPKVTSGHRSARLLVTFTDPPVAIVGAPPDADSVAAAASFDKIGRARVEGHTQGVVRLYASRASRQLTGAVMVGPGVDHLGHLLAWAVERGDTIARLIDMPFYHPTYEEILRAPLRQLCNRLKEAHPAHRDAGDPPGA